MTRYSENRLDSVAAKDRSQGYVVVENALIRRIIGSFKCTLIRTLRLGT